MTTKEVFELAKSMNVSCSQRTINRWRKGYYLLLDGTKKWYTKDHLRLPFTTAYSWETNKGYTYSKKSVRMWLKLIKNSR